MVQGRAVGQRQGGRAARGDARVAVEQGGGAVTSYSRQVAGILATATIISIAYTLYTVVAFGDESLRDPAMYILYGGLCGLIALARGDRRWGWYVITFALAVVLALGVLVYPAMFVPARQNTLGWLENDLYMGLLLLAEYLCIQRLRGVAIVGEA